MPETSSPQSWFRDPVGALVARVLASQGVTRERVHELVAQGEVTMRRIGDVYDRQLAHREWADRDLRHVLEKLDAILERADAVERLRRDLAEHIGMCGSARPGPDTLAAAPFLEALPPGPAGRKKARGGGRRGA